MKQSQKNSLKIISKKLDSIIILLKKLELI